MEESAWESCVLLQVLQNVLSFARESWSTVFADFGKSLVFVGSSGESFGDMDVTRVVIWLSLTTSGVSWENLNS